MTNITPCPYGSPLYNPRPLKYNGKFAIACQDCGRSTGRMFADSDAAIAAWNKMHAPDPLEQLATLAMPLEEGLRRGVVEDKYGKWRAGAIPSCVGIYFVDGFGKGPTPAAAIADAVERSKPPAKTLAELEGELVEAILAWRRGGGTGDLVLVGKVNEAISAVEQSRKSGVK